MQELRSSHVCHDLLNDAVRPATKKKKKNSEPEAAAAQAPAGEIPALTESRTTSTIIARLRQQINAWQKKLSDERLRSLQENVHYELTMKEEQAVVSCKLCSRNLILSSKHNKLILSNWTRHVSTCFKAPKEHNHIEKYFLNLPSQADKPCTSKSANVLSNSSSALLSSTSPTVTTVYANSATNLHVDPPSPSPSPPSPSSSSSTTSSSSSSSSSSPPAVDMSAICMSKPKKHQDQADKYHIHVQSPIDKFSTPIADFEPPSPFISPSMSSQILSSESSSSSAAAPSLSLTSSTCSSSSPPAVTMHINCQHSVPHSSLPNKQGFHNPPPFQKK